MKKWFFDSLAFNLLLTLVISSSTVYAGNKGPTGLELLHCDNVRHKVMATIKPNKSTTIRFCDAEVYFPAGSVQREVNVTGVVERDLSTLPSNITPLTLIHSVTLSDPAAYWPHGKEATIRFATNNGEPNTIFHATDKTAEWKGTRGMSTDEGLEMHISAGHFGNFLAGDDLSGIGDALLGSSDVRMRKGPYLMLTGKNTEMKVLWQTQPDFEDAEVYWAEADSGIYSNSNVLRGGTTHLII